MNLASGNTAQQLAPDKLIPMAFDKTHLTTTCNLPGWQASVAALETNLPADLFQLILQASQLSEFVASVVNTHTTSFINAARFHRQLRRSDQSLDFAGLIDEFMRLQVVESSLSAVALNQMTEQQIMRLLRIFRRVHWAVIAVFELAHELDIEETSKRLSNLADGLIQTAYHWSYKNLAQQFGHPTDDNARQSHMLVLAMGKLGGQELNFSSDIDLIFIYPCSGETQGGPRSTDNTRFFRRVATLLIKLLDEVTEDGFVFRVDMRLRPYGDSGALVLSLAQIEDYYQEQGREWERFAMLRSRILTGQDHEKEALYAIIRPFSFRRYIDYGVIDSIRNMKAMIKREVKRKGLADNIKLGAGGIREIEFIVQSMQLIQGGRDKRLQEKSTFKVLPLLVEAKLIPESVQKDLFTNYCFLRRLEHCIQALGDKQTQDLPQSDIEQTSVACAMGMENWSLLIEKVNGIRQNVNQHFVDILGEDRQAHSEADDFFITLWEGAISDRSAKEKLVESYGETIDDKVLIDFYDLVQVFKNETTTSQLTSRGYRRLNAFVPFLLESCLKTSNPDQTLVRLLRVIRAILKRTAYLELLSENPPVLQHLVDLAGRSDWIVKRLSAYPILLDELLYPNSLYVPLNASELKAELEQSLLRIEIHDEEQLLDALRAFKQINELRVAAALLTKKLNISQVSDYLTFIAEVVLQACVTQCYKMLTQQYGQPQSTIDESQIKNSKAQPQQKGSNEQINLDLVAENVMTKIDPGFAIVGYGKLGGMELGFGSDLDLVFLFNRSMESQTSGPRKISNSRFYTRLAQKIIHFLSTRTNLGVLYEVDMRLRPSGSSGLLVSHIDAFGDYQKSSAWTWEHQALIRARCVAGSESVAQQFTTIRNTTLKRTRDINGLKKDVSDMRVKMREQLEQKSMHHVDLKQAKGGLVDIEFLSQFVCLSYQGESLIPHSTSECLALAQSQALLSMTEAQFLIETYQSYRNELNSIALRQESSLVSATLFAEEMEKTYQIWQKYLH